MSWQRYQEHEEQMERRPRRRDDDEWADPARLAGFKATYCEDCGTRLGSTLATGPGWGLCHTCDWQRIFRAARLPRPKPVAVEAEDEMEYARRWA